MPPDFAALLATEFRRRLLGEYVPRIRHCAGLLSESQAWQKPAPGGNSLGNLLLHLEGNVRQWILGEIGGEIDGRDRAAEFAAVAATAPAPIPALLLRLETTVSRACTLVDGLSEAQLRTRQVFQGRYSETWFSAIVHVLEHFSGHAGQIYFWTKALTGKDLKFYDL